MVVFVEIEPPNPVPINLLPAGLPVIVPGLPDQLGNVSLFFRDNNNAIYFADFPPLLRSDAPFAELGQTLQNFARAETLNQRVEVNFEATVHLGPQVSTLAAGALGDPLALRNADLAKGDDVEIGIIDAGITFWNPSFFDDNDEPITRFASYGALKLDEGAFVNMQLSKEEIKAFCSQPDATNREILRCKYPESVYGDKSRRPLYMPDGLAHGTAMTDLLVSTAPKNTRLNGIELPVSVLRDLSGGQMSVVMDIAVRALIEQVIERRRKELPETQPEKAFRLVMLMAFAFTGGPLDGSSPILEELKKTLKHYNDLGYQFELVIPIGNHLQDQVHARLDKGDSVGWRILPEDFSANTIEIIHDARNPKLSLAQPGKDFVDVQFKQIDDGSIHSLYRVEIDEKPVGAMWTEAIGKNKRRTRITLAPTGCPRPEASTAPFGQWRIKSGEKGMQIWVLRDETGFEADPSRPHRPSWLDDQDYRRRDDVGEPPRRDPHPLPGRMRSRVFREGTASVLAASSGQNDGITVVTALEEDLREAFYAGLLPGPQTGVKASRLSDQTGADFAHERNPIGPFMGRAVLGNAGANRFRGLGTSMAAAIRAGYLAR